MVQEPKACGADRACRGVETVTHGPKPGSALLQLAKRRNRSWRRSVPALWDIFAARFRAVHGSLLQERTAAVRLGHCVLAAVKTRARAHDRGRKLISARLGASIAAMLSSAQRRRRELPQERFPTLRNAAQARGYGCGGLSPSAVILARMVPERPLAKAGGLLFSAP
jgi:hypothetical protein